MDCSWCGKPLPATLEGLAIDHIIPRARGGPDIGWNKQLLHQKCNGQKGSTLTPQARKLAAKRGVKLHAPTGSRLTPLTSMAEIATLARQTNYPPGLGDMLDASRKALETCRKQKRGVLTTD